GYGIAVDGAGNAYVTGRFEGTATFGSHTMEAMGGTDIFVAKLSYIPPKAPVNVQITMNGNSAVITWDAVTEDIHNQPFTPDGYRIYKSTDPLGGFTYQGSSSGTTYTHSMVGATEPRMFYRVTAYKY
ncbi:MAG TPA: SBBP repeat-containing protein, partial [Candidatus Syntrophosphaera sp.]|nr:SBBP repeat-containing protein [Candidatus Syntrophosphaera sp.]